MFWLSLVDLDGNFQPLEKRILASGIFCLVGHDYQDD